MTDIKKEDIKLSEMSFLELEREIDRLKDEGVFKYEHSMLLEGKLSNNSHVNEYYKRIHDKKFNEYLSMSLEDLIEIRKLNVDSGAETMDMFASEEHEYLKDPIEKAINAALEKSKEVESNIGSDVSLDDVINLKNQNINLISEELNKKLSNLNIGNGKMLVGLQKNEDVIEGGFFFVSKGELKRKGYEDDFIETLYSESYDQIYMHAASYIPIKLSIKKDTLEEKGEIHIVEEFLVEPVEPIACLSIDDEDQCLNTKVRFAMLLNNNVGVIDNYVNTTHIFKDGEMFTKENALGDTLNIINEGDRILTERIDKLIELREERKNRVAFSPRQEYLG